MIGIGTTLVGQATGAILKIVGLNHGYGTVDRIDSTDMASPNNTKEYELGLNEPGELKLDVKYEKANHKKLVDAKAARLAESWTATYPDGSTDVFTAYIAAIESAIPVADKMTASITFQKTGATAFTAGV